MVVKFKKRNRPRIKRTLTLGFLSWHRPKIKWGKFSLLEKQNRTSQRKGEREKLVNEVRTKG